MLNIYRLTPIPIKVGEFKNGILIIENQKEIKTSKEEILKRFNRGYWRTGEV